jgi:GNAT superfamily N-acetyltransferase
MTEPVPPLPAGLDPAVAHAMEMAEAHAYRDAYAAAAELPGNPVGAAVAEIGGAIALAVTAIDEPFFNRVIGLGVEMPATRADLDAQASLYRTLGSARTCVQVAHGAQPPDLTDWLAAAGYAPGGRWVTVWHDLQDVRASVPPGDIEVIRPDSAEALVTVLLAVFDRPHAVMPVATSAVGRPGWTHYLGFDGRSPVATAAMRIEDGVAWLGFGGTLPDARGRGWQTALLLRRLADAKAAGCRLAVTETGEETEAHPVNHSYRNMLRVGFRLGYARRDWNRG